MIKKILKIIFTGLIFGFLMGFFKHNGFWFKIIEGFKVIPFYLYPIVIFTAIFLNVFFHEFGHLISFLINGIKIKLISVLFVSLGKNHLNKWRIRIDFKLIKNVGGIVIPDIEKIDNDVDYENVRKRIVKALISGPNASIIYAIFTFVVYWCLIFLSDLFLLIGIMGINLLITIPFSILIILSAKVEINDLFGDYVACKKVKEDDIFALLVIIQYRLFNDFFGNDEGYFFNKIEKYFIEGKIKYSKFDYMLLVNFFKIYLDKEFNSSIFFDILKKYEIKNLMNKAEKIELAYLIAAFHYQNNNALKTFEIIDKINEHANLDIEEKYYLKIRYLHFLNIEDNAKEIEKCLNLELKKMAMLKIIFDKEKLYKEASKKLKFVECYCVVENMN